MITSAEQITPQWLTKRFQQNGHLPQHTVTDVQVGETFESTAACFTRLKVTYSTPSENCPHTNLIFKDYRENWFGGGIAESVFFNEIVAQMPAPPVFRCYDFDYDRDARQCYFIFEDASVTHTETPPKEDGRFTVALYKQIIDELLKFHTQWWEHPRISQADFLRGRGGPLRMADAATPEITRIYCQHWRETLLPQFAEKAQDVFSQEMSDFVIRAINGWERLYTQRIKDDKALTLLHGDLHYWNLFYPKNRAMDRLYFFDWETYKRGIGPYDLCYLVGGGSPQQRREVEKDLLRYYYDGLISGGVLGYSWEDCIYDYRLSVIATLFPPIGWQDMYRFKPREIQFQDWNCQELLD